MSFRKYPLTKDCDVLDVMGKRIVTAKKRMIAGVEETITNWQPFQINGRKVTPCRVRLSTPAPPGGEPEHLIYMPLINGIPMDESGARLTGSGNVYLSMKFVMSSSDPDNYIISDPDQLPTIGTALMGDRLEVDVNVDIRSITNSGWVSWKIGNIADGTTNYMRYFTGHDERWNDYDVENGPIYKKGTFYPGPPKEWGLSVINLMSVNYVNQVFAGGDLDLPLESSVATGSYCRLSENARAAGSDAGNGTAFNALLVETVVAI